jgi:hypothetical protein
MVEHIDADDLRVVWLEEAVEGFGDNRQYREIAEVSWDEVIAAIGEERNLVTLAAAKARDAREFDSVADQLIRERYTGEFDESGPIDEGPLAGLDTLDLGAMSAVTSLVAAGALTTTSCRGHHSDRGEPRPLVRFICDDRRLPLIAAAARDSRSGLTVDADGMLQLYATDIEAFIRFADEMVARREEFNTFSMEGMFESIEVYGDHLDEADTANSRYFSRRDLAALRLRIAADSPLEGQLSMFDS